MDDAFVCALRAMGMLIKFHTQFFYVWAKHFIGLHLNYLRFLGLLTAPMIKVRPCTRC